MRRPPAMAGQAILGSFTRSPRTSLLDKGLKIHTGLRVEVTSSRLIDVARTGIYAEAGFRLVNIIPTGSPFDIEGAPAWSTPEDTPQARQRAEVDLLLIRRLRQANYGEVSTK
jgi:hypothetical protein